jgi:hypothetical protein
MGFANINGRFVRGETKGVIGIEGRYINTRYIREIWLEFRNSKTWTVIQMADASPPIEIRGDWMEHIVGVAAPVVPAQPGWSVLSYHPGFGGSGNTDWNADVHYQEVVAWRVDHAGLLPVTAGESGLSGIALWPKDWANDRPTYIRSPNGLVTSCGGTTWLSDKQWLEEVRDPNSDENRHRSERMKENDREAREFREWRRQRQEVEASTADAKTEVEVQAESESNR